MPEFLGVKAPRPNQLQGQELEKVISNFLTKLLLKAVLKFSTVLFLGNIKADNNAEKRFFIGTNTL
ncbi:MAG: hypothetical protein A2167_06005 [Planctomycetes bacterium RBG_13_46_10]|nr:MAG: hypothetical protein A2167_06005 [Planctomycetes bacterium RBG_13_46_10]